MEKKKENKFNITISFYFCAICFLLYGDVVFFLGFTISILIHEYMHYLCAKNLGYKTENITLTAFGARLNMDAFFLSAKDEILVAISGPLFNLSLCVILISLWWIFPLSYLYTDILVRVNLYIFLVNLLPIFPLDGGRVMNALLRKKFTEKKIKKIFNVLGAIFSFVCMLMFIFCFRQPTFLFMSVFFFLNLFESRSVSVIEFGKSINSSLLKNGREVKFFTFSTETKLLTLYRKINVRFYSYFYIMDEKGNIVCKLGQNKIIELINFVDAKTQIKNILKIK